MSGIHIRMPLLRPRKQFCPFIYRGLQAANSLRLLTGFTTFANFCIAFQVTLIIPNTISLMMTAMIYPTMSIQIIGDCRTVPSLAVCYVVTSLTLWILSRPMRRIECQYAAEIFQNQMQKVWAISSSILDGRRESQVLSTARRLRRLMSTICGYHLIVFLLLSIVPILLLVPPMIESLRSAEELRPRHRVVAASVGFYLGLCIEMFSRELLICFLLKIYLGSSMTRARTQNNEEILDDHHPLDATIRDLHVSKDTSTSLFTSWKLKVLKFGDLRSTWYSLMRVTAGGICLTLLWGAIPVGT